MSVRGNDFNFLTSENGAKICNESSQMEGCFAENVLNNDKKTIWLSEECLPQYLTIDLKNLKIKPEKLKCFGIYCWHAYPTNPKLIELAISRDNINYNSLGNFDLNLKPGVQMLFLEEVNRSRINYLKIIIKETHGGSRTYINNIFLFEDFPESESIIVTDSRERNMPRKSDTFQNSERKGNEKIINSQTDQSNSKQNKLEVSSTSSLIESTSSPEINRGKNIIRNENFTIKNPKNNNYINARIFTNNNENSDNDQTLSINNYLLTSDNNFLLSDSEFSTHKERKPSSVYSTNPNHQNPIEEAISEEEDKSSYRSFKNNNSNIQTIQNKSLTNHPSKSNSYNRIKDQLLEDHIMKGLDKNFKIKLEHQMPTGGNSIDNSSPHRSMRLSYNPNHQFNNISSSNNYDLATSINYKALEEQLKEMQSQLNTLNLNTERIKIYKEKYSSQNDDEFIEKLINKTKKDDTQDNININSYRQANTLSQPITPKNNILSSQNNLLHNYLSVNESQFHSIQNNMNSDNNLNLMENRLYSLENEVTSLKLQMNKLNENIEILLEAKNILNANNMNFIMDECKKLINNNLPQNQSKEHNYSNMNTNMNTNTNFNTIQNTIYRNASTTDRNRSTSEHNRQFSYDAEEERDLRSNDHLSLIKSDKRKISIEEIITTRLDEKFNSLASKLEGRIFKCLLKPTVEKLENTLKGNLNELKIHLNNAERQKKQSKEKHKVQKVEKITETIDKLAKKLDRKEKILNEFEKVKQKEIIKNKISNNMGKRNQFDLSINTFDTLSEIDR